MTFKNVLLSKLRQKELVPQFILLFSIMALFHSSTAVLTWGAPYLTVVIEHATPVSPGVTLVMTITVRNGGPQPVLVADLSASFDWEIENLHYARETRVLPSGDYAKFSFKFVVPHDIAVNTNHTLVVKFTYAEPIADCWGESLERECDFSILVEPGPRGPHYEEPLSLVDLAGISISVILTGLLLWRLARRRTAKGRTPRDQTSLAILGLGFALAAAFLYLDMESSSFDLLAVLALQLMIYIVGGFSSFVLLLLLEADPMIKRVFDSATEADPGKRHIWNDALASILVNLSYFSILFFIGAQVLLEILPFGKVITGFSPRTLDVLWSDLTAFTLFVLFSGSIGPMLISIIRYFKGRSVGQEAGGGTLKLLRVLCYISLLALALSLLYTEPAKRLRFGYLFLFFVLPETFAYLVCLQAAVGFVRTLKSSLATRRDPVCQQAI